MKILKKRMLVLNICFFDRVKELRQQHHMTQAELARELDVTRSTVNAWEMGVSLPSVPKLVELAERFSTTTDYLLGIDDKKTLCVEDFTSQEQSLLSIMIEYINSNHQEKE